MRGIPVTSVAAHRWSTSPMSLSEQRLAKPLHGAEVQRVLDLNAIERTLARCPGAAAGTACAGPWPPTGPTRRSCAARRSGGSCELCESHRLSPRRSSIVNLAGYEVDAYWPDARLVVEIDGARVHHTRRAFHEDRAA